MKDKRLAAEGGPDYRQIYATWVQGYDEKNLDKVMSVFDPAVVFSESCIPDQDYAKLEKWFEFDFERSGPRPHWTFEILWQASSGDLAFAIAHWKGFTDFNTNLSAQVRGFRSIDVFTRTQDGWKILRTFNEPDGCPAAGDAAAGTKTAKKKKRK